MVEYLNFARACSRSEKLMRASLAPVVSGDSLPFVRPQPHSVATLKTSVASRLLAAFDLRTYLWSKFFTAIMFEIKNFDIKTVLINVALKTGDRPLVEVRMLKR
jgi:hypothetical protein